MFVLFVLFFFSFFYSFTNGTTNLRLDVFNTDRTEKTKHCKYCELWHPILPTDIKYKLKQVKELQEFRFTNSFNLNQNLKQNNNYNDNNNNNNNKNNNRNNSEITNNNYDNKYIMNLFTIHKISSKDDDNSGENKISFNNNNNNNNNYDSDNDSDIVEDNKNNIKLHEFSEYDPEEYVFINASECCQLWQILNQPIFHSISKSKQGQGAWKDLHRAIVLKQQHQ